MVTVIADKDDLSTPVHNGVNNSSNDTERNFHYIKDYQEVDFHRSPSCKPLPEDLHRFLDDQTIKSSIKGNFFVQIDGIEPFSSNTTPNQFHSLLVTMTDGFVTVKGITEDSIPHLNFNLKAGCKLLLNGVIPIQDGLLHLTPENTRFQYGSNTFPRPRSAYRGRGSSSYRASYEGRRGNNGNTRYDNENGDSNFFKRPPPKTTLMDFMTTLKISQDNKINTDDDNEKVKRRHQHDQSPSTIQFDDVLQTTTDSNGNEIDPNHSIDQNNAQQTSMNEPFDPEDDPSHANFRERRNPLPPRLQRAQEERSRRNTNRFYDESTSMPNNDINDDFFKGSLVSSSISHLRRHDQRSFLTNDSSSNPQQHLHSYATYSGMLPVMNSSGQTHLAYFTASSAPLAYNLGNIPNAPFATQAGPMPATYGNETFAFCYGPPYPPISYLPSPMSNGFHGQSKSFGDNIDPNVVTIDENETTVTNESQVDETNDSENRSQSSSIEPKTNISSSSSSLNDANSVAKQFNNQEKRRDPRPRWKINDLCLARWSEDREFYVATICEIHPPHCTVFFRDYHNYDQVHFRDLKPLPRDQQYYPLITPVANTSSDLNPLAASAYFPSYADYYSSAIDSCLIMPEAPPFPFNSAGTMYMYPAAIPVVPRPNHLSTYSQPVPRRNENGNLNSNPNSETTINSSSSPSKDSNDTSITDSTATSTDDVHQDDSSIPPGKGSSGSTLTSPLTLVTSNDEQSLSNNNTEEETEKKQINNTSMKNL